MAASAQPASAGASAAAGPEPAIAEVELDAAIVYYGRPSPTPRRQPSRPRSSACSWLDRGSAVGGRGLRVGHGRAARTPPCACTTPSTPSPTIERATRRARVRRRQESARSWRSTRWASSPARPSAASAPRGRRPRGLGPRRPRGMRLPPTSSLTACAIGSPGDVGGLAANIQLARRGRPRSHGRRRDQALTVPILSRSRPSSARRSR